MRCARFIALSLQFSFSFFSGVTSGFREEHQRESEYNRILEKSLVVGETRSCASEKQRVWFDDLLDYLNWTTHHLLRDNKHNLHMNEITLSSSTSTRKWGEDFLKGSVSVCLYLWTHCTVLGKIAYHRLSSDGLECMQR